MIHSRRRSREGEDAPRRASRLRRRSTTLLYIRRVGRTLVRSLAVDACNTVPNETYIFFRPSTRTAERSRELSLSLSLALQHPQPRLLDARSFGRTSGTGCLPYMTPLSHHVGECIARDRQSPRKSPTSDVHTLYYGTITRTLSPFPPIKYTHPAGRSPSRRVGRRRMQNYSYSLSSLGRRSVDADARRPTIDRARA